VRRSTCATPIAPGQSVTLRRHDVGKHHPAFAWAPECLTCTLIRISSREEAFDRFRCRACGRPLRISATNRAALSPTCCERCARAHRTRKNKLRRRIPEHEPIACIVCGASFVPRRIDARTCSNKCRQRAFRAAQA
jgi:hypothetical protein